MIHTETCFTLCCDGCQRSAQDEDSGYTPHFSSAEHGLAQILDADQVGEDHVWTRDGDRLLCPECTAKAACERDGHDWTEWLGCRCGQPERHAGENVAQDWRFCNRGACHARETRIAQIQCEARPQPPALSAGARLIEHRRNHELYVEAGFDSSGPHVVPESVEDLVAQGAAIAELIDAALPDGYVVR